MGATLDTAELQDRRASPPAGCLGLQAILIGPARCRPVYFSVSWALRVRHGRRRAITHPRLLHAGTSLMGRLLWYRVRRILAPKKR